MASFPFTFDTPTNPWVITHNLDDSNVFWVIYDSSGEYLLPTSAVATSLNVFTFTFDEAITGAGSILSVLDLVTFASTQSFTDLVTVKNALGLVADDSSQDSKLTRLIVGVSESMKNYMRRSIVETAHTAETHSGRGKQCLILNHYPVVAASGVSVSVDGDLFASANYVIDEEAAILQGSPSGNVFPSGVGNITVTYVSGSVDGVPQDLNLACVKQVLYELRLQNDRHTIALSNASITGVFSETYLTGEWAQGVEPILSRYRKRSIG
jgi:hypothetical protein